MSDFKSPEGSFAKVETGQTAGKPRQSGVPSAGITNESRGKLAPTGAGPATGANGTRIR